MNQIYLPPTVLYNLERERMASRHEALQWFDRELKALDPYLELVKAHENAEAVGIKPGYWHVRRTDPVTGWQHYIPLRGPNGEFSEPHSGHLEMLRRTDLQRPGAMDELRKRWAKEDEDRAKEAAWMRAELKEEFVERYMSKTRPSVSFSDVAGWRNRVGARKG